MAATVNTPNLPQISPLDALWSLFTSQPKAVRKAFAKRLEASLLAEKEAKTASSQVKSEMDLSLEDIKKGDVVSFENVDDAIAYLNS